MASHTVFYVQYVIGRKLGNPLVILIVDLVYHVI